MKQVLRRIQAGLPKGLARIDRELEQLVAGYLGACDIAFERIADDGHVRFEVAASPKLPEGFETGGTVIVGRASDPDAARSAASQSSAGAGGGRRRRARHRNARFAVTWKVDASRAGATAASRRASADG